MCPPLFGSRRALLAAALVAFSAPAVVADRVPGGWEVVGTTGVSAQQFFLGGPNKVYILDKVENNPLRSPSGNGPAWATEYNTQTNTYRAMEVSTNSFCAGGTVMGNGTWISAGGNKAVTWGALQGVNLAPPYYNDDGGRSIRLLDPCDNDDNCQWAVNPGGALMQSKRWYPTIETLEDGSVIIIGGCSDGGYVNDASQNIPTVEYFPSRGSPVGLNILTRTLPANLYTLTWLLPSGNLFFQTNWATEIFDYKTNTEYPLPDIPHAVRTYPGSAATAMLPLTPQNNYTATVLFCGGTNLQPDQWTWGWNIAGYPADSSCVQITPDVNANYVEVDAMPEGRVMGQFVILPTGVLWMGNGIARGTAGYGNTSWAVGQAFGQDPIFAPAYFDPNAPNGHKWSRPMQNATVGRLYHSVATLLADGSILTAGSNPNADYIAPDTPGYPYVTEYRAEKFYPEYYFEKRPAPSGVPKSLSYGGAFFNVTLSASDLGNSSAVASAYVAIVRPGYSTHAMNMGQRYLQLNNTYTVNSDGSAVLHVAQMPPNPAMFQPGPALAFVVVNGVPSNGTMVMVGTGSLGTQPTSPQAELPGAYSSRAGSDGGASGASAPSRASPAAHVASNLMLVLTIAALAVARL